MFTVEKLRVPERLVLAVGLNAVSWPVALNVAGFPLIPLPAIVAVNVFGPAAAPRVQLPTVAMPSVPVLGVAPLTLPPPLTTANVTATPEIGAPVALVTLTAGGTGTG
jgi:hypothetical protein